jgi:DNA-directed RNA polymerase subunit RPC12/RpoP
MTEHAEFRCSACGQTAEHDLRYAGRLLESTRCHACGHVVELQPKALLPAYLLDLEQRVTSKPARMLQRANDDRGGFIRSLPMALARQPVKLARELWTVIWR